MSWELLLPLTAAGSGAAWARLAARRAGEGRVAFTLQALLGGVAAFGLALCAYDLLAAVGAEIQWRQIARGGAGALLAGAAVGLVEEGAKLAGLLLAVERGARRAAVLATAVGVAAGFAAFEAVLVLQGETSAPALARAAFAPVAHALLAAPLAAGVAASLDRARRAWVPLVPALLGAAALHAAADLSLALPGIGGAGYAAVLALPALAAFARSRLQAPPVAPPTRRHLGAAPLSPR